ncbi:hypothetical protein NDU88_004438 [Pleurodeles waltl]|uniref:Uncharacterized protein n=1 Tax=Pleurodeles waltl TaxID=8319 RepID=A0AAV7QFF0_PLEWA|nr:hypothetical protein NDU88_004438 [Pleurodeles waltl]
MGLLPPRVILAWRGGGARRTPWPLCPSSGAGPHGRSAPETARVPVSVPRGRCGDQEVRGRLAARLLRRSWCGSADHVAAVPLAARGRMAARLFRRRMASLPSAFGGAGRMAARRLRRRRASLPSYGRGRWPLGCIAFHAERGAAEGGAEARPGEPTPPATEIRRVGQCQRASNQKKKKGGKRAITAAQRRA